LKFEVAIMEVTIFV